MQNWQIWDPLRFFYLFVGAAYLLVWVQVLLLHWKGAFRSWYMWGPVLYTPVLFVTGIAYVFRRGGGMNVLLVGAYFIGALLGISGIFHHFRAVGKYVGGYTLRNFLVGPPVMLPVMYFALSAGVLIVYFLWGM